MLDLSKFKKLETNKTHTIMQHQDGHILQIAHKGVDEATRKELKQLPTNSSGPGERAKPRGMKKYAEGDVVQPDSSSHDDLANSILQGAAEDNRAQYNPAASDVPEGPQNASLPQAPQQPTQGPQGNDSFGYGAEYNEMSGARQQGLQGLEQQRQADTATSQAENTANRKAAKRDQDWMNDITRNSQAMAHDTDKFMADLANNHIDPNQYLNRMGTGQRIATAIGLILGGAGSGGDPSKNSALTFLNQQIDRNIQSQVADMGNKKTLLEANFHKYQDMQTALGMTRIQLNEMALHQMGAAATQSGSIKAQSAFNQATAAFRSQYAPIIQQGAMRQAMMQGTQQGQIAPESYIGAMLPKEQQEPARKALGEYKAAQELESMYKQSFQDIINKKANGLFSPRDVGSATNLLKGMIGKATSGRYNDQEAEQTLDAILPSYADILGPELADKKLQRGLQLMQRLKQEPASQLQGMYVPLPGAPKTNKTPKPGMQK